MPTEQLPVDIVGDHPHVGRRGTVEVVDGNVTTTRVLGGAPMIRVTFGEHDECFAEARHLRKVRQ